MPSAKVQTFRRKRAITGLSFWSYRYRKGPIVMELWFHGYETVVTIVWELWFLRYETVVTIVWKLWFLRYETEVTIVTFQIC